MRVDVAYAGPEGEEVERVDLPAAATLADALARSTLPLRLGLDLAALSFALYGQRAAPHSPLRDGDRVELLRPLAADPKVVRRQRAAENPLPRPRPRAKRQRESG